MTSIHHLTAAPLHRKPLSQQPPCVSIHDFARQFGFQPDPAQSELSLTGGEMSQHSAFRWYVPRKELLVGLQGQVCRREIEIASGLHLAHDFVDEMAGMGRNLHAPAGGHDDLVMAVALAAWCSRRRPRGRIFP